MPRLWRMQVVAHRGASEENAEHTLGAYLAALDAGADGLECDVRLTADGHLVCVHDRSLRRTAATPGSVSTMELKDLSELDMASWKNPWADLDDEAPDTDPELGRVLTLRKLLETVADCDRRVELAVETKHPTRYGGLVTAAARPGVWPVVWNQSSIRGLPGTLRPTPASDGRRSHADLRLPLRLRPRRSDVPIPWRGAVVRRRGEGAA